MALESRYLHDVKCGWTRPRFGSITRLLSVVFLIAGLGAAIAALTSGHQTTSGHADDLVILAGIAIIYVVVGTGLWLELLWAWWAGVGLTVAVVVLGPLLREPDQGWIVWSVFLGGFVGSAIQGWQDAS
jgi:ABC-type antimicrobial peptide transport system permease subunit